MDFSLFHFGTNCNLLQFNTLHGATPHVQWCKDCLADDAHPLPDLNQIGIDSRIHPVHNVLCN